MGSDAESVDADENVDVEAQRAAQAEVLSALAALPRDTFAERAPLLTRRDELATQVRAATVVDPEVLALWADRAAGTRGPEPIPFIQSHGEGGSGS
jgi:hypothetical protein